MSEKDKKNQLPNPLSKVFKNSMFERLLNFSEDLIILERLESNDKPGGVVEVNDRACSELGYTRDDFLKLKMSDLADVKTIKKAAQSFQTLMETGTAELEANLICKNRTSLTFEVKSHLFEEDNQKYILSICKNISSRKKQADKINKEMEFVEAALNAQRDTFFVFDPKSGQAVYWNRIFEEMSGYSPQEIADLPAPDSYFNEDDHDTANKAIEEVYKNGSTRVELNLRTKNKNNIPMEYSVSTITDGNNEVKYLISIGRDISEKKKVENELRISRERLIKAQKIAHVGSYEADFPYNKVHFSEELIRIYGRSPEDYPKIFTVEESFQWVHPDDIQYLQEQVQIAAEKGLEELKVYYRIVWPDDTIRNVLGVTRLNYNDKMELIGIEGSIQDITERLIIEQKLKDKTNQLQTLINSSPDIICFKNGKGCWLEANETDLELFQLKGVDYKGKTDAELAEYTHPMYHESFMNCMESDEVAWAKGKLSRGEEIIPSPDGKERIFDILKIPVFKENGEREGLVVLGRDITDRIQAEKERDKIETDFRQAQKMEAVGRLAGGVAHDFNNMLNVIMGNTEMAMLSISREDPIFQELKEVEKAAQRSADLTRQLLAFSRKQAATPSVVSLNSVVLNQKKMLGRLIGEHIEIIFNSEENLWNVFIDPSQLDQILTNLAVNARDAISETGVVTISTENIMISEKNREHFRDLDFGEYVLLKFEDSGSGMDSNTLEQIFEPFFTTKAKGKGTGLGLSTVFGIIKQNNGMIFTHSVPGKGTIFEIYLPRHIGEADINEKLVSKKSFEGKETILVVEDEKSVRKLARRILEKQGYLVYTASTPNSALEIIDGIGEKIDLLLTDVIMPQMNGKELHDLIQQKYPGMRTLFMSGYTADVIAQHGVLENDVDFLQKPFSLNSLISKIRVILDRNK